MESIDWQGWAQLVEKVLVPTVTAAVGFVANRLRAYQRALATLRKEQNATEAAVKVLKAEVDLERATNKDRHSETINMLKEMREESREGLREVRASISQLMNREGK